MEKAIWIDDAYDHKVGDRGFLVRVTHVTKGWRRYDLCDRPARTNQSHEYRLEGWCGTTNDVSVYAQGAGEIVKIAKNGRALVRHLDEQELDETLDDFGFPELK